MELILDEKGKEEINRLWVEFDYIASFTARTWVQYYFNQSGEVQGKGAESASARPVGREITDSTVIIAMRDAYLAKAAADPSNDPVASRAIREHYDGSMPPCARLKSCEQRQSRNICRHLLRFAARAYRRPLSKTESDDLLAYYRTLRSQNRVVT